MSGGTHDLGSRPAATVAYRTLTLCGDPFQRSSAQWRARARRLPPPPARSSNPPLASPAGCAASRVWAPPRSLAATEGILSFPRGTEMFQFPRCPPGSPARCPAVRRAGCPIRRSPDHRLPAPPRGISPRGRVLPRPPTPRHPPCAHHAEALIRLLHRPDARQCRSAGPARATGTSSRRRPPPARRPSRSGHHSRSRPDSARLLHAASAARRSLAGRWCRWRPPRLARGLVLLVDLRHVCDLVCVRCVCMCSILTCSARGRPDTSTPAPPSPVPPGGSVPEAPPGLGGLVPRPQNLAGSAWRIVKVLAGRERRPTGLTPRRSSNPRSSRSSNLVRSRPPTSDL